MSEQLDIEKMVEKGFKALYDKKGRKREEAFTNGVKYANLQMWNLLKKYEKELQQKENIIKEVREKLIDLFGTDDKDINEILQILDKENK